MLNSVEFMGWQIANLYGGNDWFMRPIGLGFWLDIAPSLESAKHRIERWKEDAQH